MCYVVLRLIHCLSDYWHVLLGLLWMCRVCVGVGGGMWGRERAGATSDSV